MDGWANRLQVMRECAYPREWADLPNELLQLILSTLFAKDRHNFRLVCRSWNAAAASSPYHDYPCLMFYQSTKRLWKIFQSNSSFYMSFPELCKADIRCSKYGWLLMSRDYGSLFFFDPFNRQKIELPSATDYKYTTIYFFNPPTSPDCFLVGIGTLTWSDEVQISVLTHGEHEWKTHTYHYSNYPFLVSMSGPVLHSGQLYFLDVKGNVATFDINQHDGDKSRWIVYTKCLWFPRRLINKIKQHFLFKIKDEEEALYAVFLICEEGRVNVFRLLKPEMRWESVKDLGEKMLYLNHTSSFGVTARPESMANTIHFPKFHGDDILFYSLNTRKYHSLEGDCSYNNSINLTRLDFNVTWITPALAPEQLSTKFTWC